MAYIKWSLDRIVTMICNILQNRFDCAIAIEGNRGLGKSTLAIKLAKKVRFKMKRLGVDGYRFFPKRDLLYRRKDVINFFNKWHYTGIADEMINVTFNRDFYNEDQKDIIKMINMNRDHCNLFFACIPQFQALDNQIKNLMKIRITVVRRGVAIIQTPNNSIYSKDKWDQAVNEKIEREWMKSNTKNPKYSKLTTFRGYMHFSPLTEKEENLYQEIKDEKRNEIMKEKNPDADKDEEDPFEKVFKDLEEGKIRNSIVLDGMAQLMDLNEATLKARIKRRLAKEKKPTTLSSYYWDSKEKKKEVADKNKGRLQELLQKVSD